MKYIHAKTDTVAQSTVFPNSFFVFFSQSFNTQLLRLDHALHIFQDIFQEKLMIIMHLVLKIEIAHSGFFKVNVTPMSCDPEQDVEFGRQADTQAFLVFLMLSKVFAVFFKHQKEKLEPFQ